MKTILIVEDNDKNMKLARDILQFQGFAVLEAINGLAGVAQALAHRPDLVLMDIQLPDIDGFEAFRRIRADPRRGPWIAVGMPIAGNPPHRSGHAQFTHPAPALGNQPPRVARHPPAGSWRLHRRGRVTRRPRQPTTGVWALSDVATQRPPRLARAAH